MLQKTIRELQEKAQDFNKKQMLFGEEVKNYKNVFDMSRCVASSDPHLAQFWANYLLVGMGVNLKIYSVFIFCHPISFRFAAKKAQ